MIDNMSPEKRSTLRKLVSGEKRLHVENYIPYVDPKQSDGVREQLAELHVGEKQKGYGAGGGEFETTANVAKKIEEVSESKELIARDSTVVYPREPPETKESSEVATPAPKSAPPYSTWPARS